MMINRNKKRTLHSVYFLIPLALKMAASGGIVMGGCPPYTPPVGNNVEFNLTMAYTPPAGNNVQLDFCTT